MLMLLTALCLTSVMAQLVQKDISLTVKPGEAAHFVCKGTDFCHRNYVYWYQRRHNGTYIRVLRVNHKNGDVYTGYFHPDRDDFTAVHIVNGCELQIPHTKPSHTASYHCACFICDTVGGSTDSPYLVFGSGTQLYVTYRDVAPPRLTVYGAPGGPLVCAVSSMIPPVVRFSWTMRDRAGRVEQLSDAGLEMVQGEHHVSIMPLPLDSQSHEYYCEVQHQAGTVEALVKDPSQPSVLVQAELMSLCLLYSLFISKTLVYCSALPLINQV